ncbi:MAG: hypothetical protein AAGF99_19950, partial [Bacteroidota bacterium]
MRTSLASLVFMAASLVVLASLTASVAHAQPAAGTLTLTEETVTWDDSVSATFERGIFNAPANRVRGSAGTIPVEIVRFHRNADAPGDVPPIVLLQGGPGYGTFDDYLGGSWFYVGEVEPLLNITDVILVGQRGFGPGVMPCDEAEALSLAEAFDDATRERTRREAIAQCRQKWEAAGRDLAGINVIEAAADVADAARLLGYDRIQVYGKSFGSHQGMAVVRYHPDLVVRATLGALEGPDHTYDSPDGVLETLERIAAAADTSAALRALVPEEGLLAAYRALIHRADAEPITVETTNPRTEEAITVQLDGDDFRELVRGVTRGLKFRYIMPAWPLDILTMLNGDYAQAGRRITGMNTSTRVRSAGWYAFDCASGISAERGERYRQSAAAEVVGPLWRDYDVDCAAWGGADLGEAFRTGFVTDVPTLLAQGTWDMNTPYENATDLLPA